mmetsp:Transcript_61805/g.164298  ORF Transcript_61805/g.164298 Transcript_61805/m.164298 type:complete len:107 (-) Transcript_61805:220-540(-)
MEEPPDKNSHDRVCFATTVATESRFYPSACDVAPLDHVQRGESEELFVDPPSSHVHPTHSMSTHVGERQRVERRKKTMDGPRHRKSFYAHGMMSVGINLTIAAVKK